MLSRVKPTSAVCMAAGWMGFMMDVRPAEGEEYLTHLGMCDASAAVALDARTFAVANDEDNVIRVYLNDRSGPPLQQSDVSLFLQVDREHPETDLEGASWLGERIFWITSHGRNKSGKYRQSRHRLFAMKVDRTAGMPRLVPDGRPYRDLLRDLVLDPRLRPFNLLAASQRPPKDPGALNIESLCATPRGELLIGFRNPIPEGRALVVPLTNPNEVVSGAACRFGEPLRLELDGLGVRDMMAWPGGYLIVAGAFDKGQMTRLYFWPGGSARPQMLQGGAFAAFNPEAIVSYPGETARFHILSDDGTLDMGGVECKNLPDPARRQFRSMWHSMAP